MSRFDNLQFWFLFLSIKEAIVYIYTVQSISIDRNSKLTAECKIYYIIIVLIFCTLWLSVFIILKHVKWIRLVYNEKGNSIQTIPLVLNLKEKVEPNKMLMWAKTNKKKKEKKVKGSPLKLLTAFTAFFKNLSVLAF